MGRLGSLGRRRVDPYAKASDALLGWASGWRGDSARLYSAILWKSDRRDLIGRTPDRGRRIGSAPMPRPILGDNSRSISQNSRRQIEVMNRAKLSTAQGGKFGIRYHMQQKNVIYISI